MKSLNFLHSLSRSFAFLFSLVLLAMVSLTSTAEAASAHSQQQQGRMIPQCQSCCIITNPNTTLTLNPTSGYSLLTPPGPGQPDSGTTITATGTGYVPYGSVKLQLYIYGPYITLVQTQVDSNGNLNAQFQVPWGLAPLSYQVEASGCGDAPAFANLQALQCPPTAMFVSPYYVQPGQIATIYGCGFQAYASISITGGVHGYATADGSGLFTFSWRIPKIGYACYIVMAADSFGHTASGGFCRHP